MWRSRSVSSKIAIQLKKVAISQGYDFSELLQLSRLSNNFEEMIARGRLSEQDHMRVLQLYEQPSIFKTIHSQAATEGLSFIFDDFMDYVSICSTSPTLASAISNFVRYRFLMGTCDDVSLQREGDTVVVKYDYSSAQSDLAGQANIYFIMLLDLIKTYAMTGPLNVEVNLVRENLDFSESDLMSLVTTLNLGQSMNTLTVNAAWLDEPQESKNEYLHQLYQRKVNVEFQDALEQEFAQRVAKLILLNLHQGEKSELLLSLVCQTLHVSRATLHRRLLAESTSYSHILRDVRKKEVIRLLSMQHKPFIDVSQSLGFTNVSSFNRFIKANFDTTPSDFRARLRHNMYQ